MIETWDASVSIFCSIHRKIGNIGRQLFLRAGLARTVRLILVGFTDWPAADSIHIFRLPTWISLLKFLRQQSIVSGRRIFSGKYIPHYKKKIDVARARSTID
uniref:AsIV-cont00097-ORF3 n=1 Tax=Apophua simplicipes ichnovirus TaxID=1329648 RepID=S5DT36_9VIRU|nr:AsIV-cont00097-ORF3 [Apophua simplicipes ichnovirus]